MSGPTREPDRLLDAIFDKIDRDFSFLLGCLREVLTDLGEPEVAARLAPLDPLHPQALDPACLTDCRKREIQALSIAFQLLNLVEENAAAQIRRLRESREGMDREPGLWGAALRTLRDAGLPPERIAEALPGIRVEPVLTAHPTEAKRPGTLQIHRSLYLLLVKLENQMWTPAERDDIRMQIMAQLERLWRTGEIYLERPDVSSELENVLHYLRNVFPEALRRLDDRLRQAWIAAGFDAALIASPDRRPAVRFGTWVGGDRDGHPGVTPEVTRMALGRLRECAAEVLDRELCDLSDRLTLNTMLVEAPEALKVAIDWNARELGEEALPVLARDRREPWRQFVQLLRRKLAGGRYRLAEELLADLALLRQSLVEIGAVRLADLEVTPVQRIAQAFGLHLATLDIRQNSAYHDRALAQLLEAAGIEDHAFPSWTEEKKRAFLNGELRSPRPFAPRRAALGPEAQSVLGSYAALVDTHDRYGGEGIGALVVSMTRDLSDLLVVYVLAREAGLARHESGGLVCLTPVCPLFETEDDLQRAPGILGAFLDHPVTRRSLALQGAERPVQQVMLGYSDSNKDAGFAASNWAIHRAQREIVRAAAERGVDVCFFHGRGGSASRGAGPTHRFFEAMPHGSLTGSLRLTEQGETIAQKYANLITATYNLELLLAGATQTALLHRSTPNTEDPAAEAAMESLAQHSRDVYRELLTDPAFITYWSGAAPVDALEASSIGSRPARRTGARSLADLRAIPWVFGWNQNRHYITGWYGLGGGLARLREQQPDRYGALRSAVHRWPFLRNLLYNAETTLASADPGLMATYAALVEDVAARTHVFGLIRAEYDRCEREIAGLFQAPREARRPRMLRTVRLRDPGLRRLHALQTELLVQWRRAVAENRAAEARALLPTVLFTLNAVASGLRNTG